MDYQITINDKPGEGIASAVVANFAQIDGSPLQHRLTVTDQPNDQARLALVSKLSAFNQSKAGESRSRLLSVLIHDNQNTLLGGLWGSTGYQWLCTHLLIIPEKMRGQGVGTEIMGYAEREALRRGCHSAWLDTYEFQARTFYERLGYECFGELKDCPSGFSRYFMKKRIAGTT